MSASTCSTWLALIALGSACSSSWGQSMEDSLRREDPAALAKAALEQGDARRGAIVFHQPFLGCAKCHGLGNEAQRTLGPDLARIGRELTGPHIVESVLQPSKAIEKGYETITVGMSDGRTISGLKVAEDQDQLVLLDATGEAKEVALSKAEIEERAEGAPSLMPAGLVNTLSTRQQFLDLVLYLREINSGGPDRARALQPDPAQIAGVKLPEYEQLLDHSGLISALGPESLERGEAIYNRVCVNCHGTTAVRGSMPTSLQFATGKFKNGTDPLSLYRTLTHGFGQMPPQTWMVPSQKYDVIHYLREAYLRDQNPTQYALVDRGYLDRLPRGTTFGPEPSQIEAWSAMDYGPTLTSTYEIGDDGSNFAYKGIAVRLDPGPGGVSRGHRWSVFEHDTLRMAAVWSGDDFIDWNGINFNGRHETHPRVAGRVLYGNPGGPGWANPASESFEDPRLRGRDDRPYGPLPREWAHFRGQYRHGDQVILDYTVGETPILETSSIQESRSTSIAGRTFNIGPRPRELILQVAHWSGSTPRLRHLSLEDDPSREYVLLEPAGVEEQASNQPRLEFNGDAYVELEASDTLHLGRSDFTLAARFRTTRGGTIFCETLPGDRWVPDGKSLFIRGGKVVFDVGWVGAIESKRKVDDGAWHDVVLSYRHDTGLATLHLDGRAERDGRLPARSALERPVHRLGFTAPDFPLPDTRFVGELSAIRVFDGVLEPAALASDAIVGRSGPRPIATWSPERAQGELVHDDSGNGNDGEIVRSAPPIRPDRLLAWLAPPVEGSTWSSTPGGDLRLRIPAGPGPIRFTLRVAPLPAGQEPAEIVRSSPAEPVADLASLTHGGPARWPERISTTLSPGAGDGPFSVDTIGVPENNPWLCQTRLSGFDFLEQGQSAAVCTWDGDVWLVRGLAENDGELIWKRIASGLFQPLGLKIRDGSIYVSCRDQIVRLHDLNGDEEIDFYENFNSDHQVTEHFHEFAMGLQTDAQGNFYYAKAARHGKTALVPQHGTLIRVSQDGLTSNILATGFRAPNGVCVNDDGTFFLTDQEGFWNPKNRINLVRTGSFHGNMWGYHDITDSSDSAMTPPLCWITNAFDRSPSEPVRVESPAWGPLDGALLNFSYGYGKIYVVPSETVAGVRQGGMCALPIPSLPTGVMRGRFHPVDRQLYCCGMFAWAGNQSAPGGFFRVRATGKPMYLPVGLNASKRGLDITFSDSIDPTSARDPSAFSVKIWSIKRTENYGSDHYDEHTLPIHGAKLSADGRVVSLEIPGLQPTQCMEITCRIRGHQGEVVERTIHNTIHRLAD